ncbi:MAG: SixA phosphatase family protein [Methylophagaceae bacterium]
MKKLHLLRHAKSSWTARSLADSDRPLNQRGVKSCSIMATQIMNAGCHFDHVFCSTAVRAQSTIEHIEQQLTDHNFGWQLDDALYTFDYQVLLQWCRELDDSLSEVVIIGHNPALTDFCNLVGDCAIDNLATCSYVQLAFHRDSWQELSAGSADMVSFLMPKMFMTK